MGYENQEKALKCRLFEARTKALKPKPKLTLSQWADEYRVLSSEASSTPGKWKTSRVEVARGPMDAVTDPSVHTVSIMCATQTMKTEVLLAVIGYHIHQDPAPIVLMQPTVELAEAFSKDRFRTMVRDSPALAAIVADPKQKDSGSTILHATFPGGHLTMVGSTAPGQLAMRPIRIVLCDEVDKYPDSAGKEGDPIKLLSERSATFWNRKKVFVCSPTIEGKSRIAIEYENSDKRIYEIPCPHCDHTWEPVFANVKWPKGEPDRAKLQCPACFYDFSEPDRQRAIRAGKWRATAEFKGHAGFRASKLVSPWQDMAALAQKFLESKDNQNMLKTFVNTQLAETYKEKGDAPEWRRLYDKREDYELNKIPMRARVLTAFCDVQRDRLEVEVVAWGPNLESWSIDYRVLTGDPASLSSPCWEQLRAMLSEQWPHESGVMLSLRRMGIDSGDGNMTQTVYNFVRQFDRSRVLACKGNDSDSVLMSPPRHKDVNTKGKSIKRGIAVWGIGTHIAKHELYGFLRLDLPTDPEQPVPYGYCHFPQYNEHFFKMLTAEEVIARKVKGYTQHSWEKKYERNEALDCRVGNRAIASSIGVDRFSAAQWETELGHSPKVQPVVKSAPASVSANIAQSNSEKTEKKKREPRKSSFW